MALPSTTVLFSKTIPVLGHFHLEQDELGEWSFFYTTVHALREPYRGPCPPALFSGENALLGGYYVEWVKGHLTVYYASVRTLRAYRQWRLEGLKAEATEREMRVAMEQAIRDLQDPTVKPPTLTGGSGRSSLC